MNNNYEMYIQLLQLLNNPQAQVEINSAVDNALKAFKKLLSTVSTSEYLPEIAQEIANMYKIQFDALLQAKFTREEAMQLMVRIGK